MDRQTGKWTDGQIDSTVHNNNHWHEWAEGNGITNTVTLDYVVQKNKIEIKIL